MHTRMHVSSLCVCVFVFFNFLFKKHVPTLRYHEYYSIFSSIDFRVLLFVFKPLIYLSLDCLWCCALGCWGMPAFLHPQGLHPARLLCPWDFPGQNIGAGCHCPLQGIFPTQGSNLCLPGLLHSRWILSC